MVVLRAIRISHEFAVSRGDDRDGGGDGDRGQGLRWGWAREEFIPK